VLAAAAHRHLIQGNRHLGPQRGDLPFERGPFALECQLLPLDFFVQAHALRPLAPFLRHARRSGEHSTWADIDVGELDAGARFFKRHEDARLIILGGAAHKKFHCSKVLPQPAAPMVVEMAGFANRKIPTDGLSIDPKLACDPSSGPTSAV
jgi:hypothetical protein